jgi:hypothetical protein
VWNPIHRIYTWNNRAFETHGGSRVEKISRQCYNPLTMTQVLQRSKIRKTKTQRAPAPHNLTQRDWRAIQRARKRKRIY